MTRANSAAGDWVEGKTEFTAAIGESWECETVDVGRVYGLFRLTSTDEAHSDRGRCVEVVVDMHDGRVVAAKVSPERSE